MSSKYFVGIDVGSRTSKAVIWDGIKVIGRSLIQTGWTPEVSARTVFEKALEEAHLVRKGEDDFNIVATGYGRVTVPFVEKTVTEITAHARGVAHLLPETQTLIDIGGQDSKAIIIEDGIVSDFAMNDRCAAGSGKFLEFLAGTLELSIDEFADIAYSSNNPITISSICTVFAETELLSLLAEGVAREDIAAGVHRSIAMRVGQLVKGLHPQPPFAFSGGVAYNRCLIRELEQLLGNEIIIPDSPEFAGALGASLIASEL